MSDLSRLLAKPVKVTLGKGKNEEEGKLLGELGIEPTEVTFSPMKLKDFLLFEGTDIDKPTPDVMLKLMKKIVKDLFPGASDESIVELPVVIVQEIMELMEKYNGIKPMEGNAKAQFMETVRKAQQGEQKGGVVTIVPTKG